MDVLAGCVVSCMCSYRAATVRVQVLERLPQPVGRQIHLQKKESTEQNKNKPHSILEFRSRKTRRRQSICFAKTGLGEGRGGQRTSKTKL
eukprot:COSAG06_NODE_11458_length_1505_cov_53.816501_2_plen_90_part_00